MGRGQTTHGPVGEANHPGWHIWRGRLCDSVKLQVLDQQLFPLFVVVPDMLDMINISLHEPPLPSSRHW